MNQSTSFAQVATNLLNVLQGYTKGIRFVAVLTMLLMLGIGQAWADTWTWTAANGNFGTSPGSQTGTVTLNGKSWNYSRDEAGYLGWGNSSIQFGSKNNPENVTLSTSAFSSYTITSISVKASSYNGAHKLTIKVGDATVKSATTLPEPTSSPNAISTGTISKKGDIRLEFSNKSRALYIQSISVTYEEAAATVPVTGVSLNTSTLTLTEGSSETLTAFVSPDNATDKTVTWTTNKSSVATVSNGKVTAVAEGSAIITVTTNDGKKTATCNVTVNPKPKYTVTLDAGPGSCAASVTETSAGAGVTLPEPTLDCGDWKFAGWATSPVEEEITKAPKFITDKPYKPSGNITLHAVYQRTETIEGVETTTTTTDILTRETTDVDDGSTTYSSWSGKTVTSSAVYAGNSAGSNNSIQLRSNNSNSGVITTDSGGKAKKVTVEWQSSTASGRTLDIYGKNSAYSAATDLYSTSTQGTKLGSIVNGTSTELTITGDYEYIGLRSNSGAMYLTSISIDWATTTNGGASTTYYHSTPECTTKTSVTLNPNGGTISASGWMYNGSKYTQIVETTSDVILPTPNDKTGYTFNGWYENSSFTGSSVTKIAAGTTGNKEFWAKWTAKQTQLLINANTANHGSGSGFSVVATYGEALPNFNPCTPVTGYTLDGYYTAAIGGTKIIDLNGKLVSNVSGYTSADGKWASEAEQLVLYAQYLINTYTIKFDNQGHGTKPDNQTINHGGKVNNPGNLTANGFIFGGWYKEEGCSNAWDFATDVVTSGTTLYAKWTPIEYQITYEGLGGASNEDNPTIYTIESETITFEEPGDRVGYIFKGWEPATIEKGSTGPVTVTAKWCELLGNATELAVDLNFINEENGQTYVKFSWTPANNTISHATKQVICIGKVGEEKKCTDLEKNQVWSGDLRSKLTPGEYKWTIQAIGNGETYCDGEVISGPNFTIEEPLTDNCRWVEIALEDITPEDEIVVTMGNDKIGYALGTEKITNSPKSQAITITSGMIDINQDFDYSKYTWSISAVSGGYTLQPYGTPDIYLYGVKSYISIGNNNTNNVFTIFTSPENGNKCFMYTIEYTPYYLGHGTEDGQTAWTRQKSYNFLLNSNTLKFYKKTCLPANKFWIDYELANVTCTSEKPAFVGADTEIELSFSAYTGYKLPEQVSITMGGNTLPEEAFAWEAEEGILYIVPKDGITGDIVITVEGCELLAIPTNLKANNITSSSATLSWDKIDHATEYQVHITDDDDSTEDIITTTSNTYYEVTGLSSASEYLWGVTPIASGYCGLTQEAEIFTTLDVYTVTFNTNGGTAVEPQNIDHGGKAAKPTDPTKTGYKFVGWYTEADTEFNFNTPIESATTLYAKWNANQYTITFSKQWGDGGTANATVTFNSNNFSVATIDLPTRGADYKFGGYYTETGGAGLQIVDAEGIWQKNKDGYLDANGNWIKAESVTLYAKWTKIHTITWVVNNNTETPHHTSTALDGSTIDALPTPPADDLFEDCEVNAFVGWSTDNIGLEPDATAPTDLFKTLSEAQSKIGAINGDKKFYAVYANASNGADSYKLATTLEDLFDGQTVIIAKDNGALEKDNNTIDKVNISPDGNGNLSNVTDNIKWTLEASDTHWKLKNNGGYLGVTSTANQTAVSVTETNNVWQIAKSAATGDYFYICQQNTTIGLQYFNNQWQIYSNNSIASSTNFTLKIYVPNVSNYITRCTALPDPVWGGATIDKTEISVNCGETSSANGAAQISFPKATNYNLYKDITVEVTSGNFIIASSRDGEYTTSVTLTPTQSGTNVGTLDGKYVYVRAVAPPMSSDQLTGTITISGKQIATQVINVTATVTCDEYTLTFNDCGDTQKITDFAGTSVEEMEPWAEICSEPVQYVFDGWATEPVTNGAEGYEKVDFSTFTMPNNNTTILYAVYRYAEEGGEPVDGFVKVTEALSDWTGDYVIVNETAKKAIGNAYKTDTKNDKTLIATDVTIIDNKIHNPTDDVIWQIRKSGLNYTMYNADASKYAYITGGDSENAGLSDAVQYINISWGSSPTTVRVIGSDYSGRCFSYYTNGNEWRTYAASGNNVTGALYKLSNKSLLYTSSLICGEISVEEDNVVVTSTKDQTVKVYVPITLKYSGAASITGTSENEAFTVVTKNDVAVGESTIEVHYKPTAYVNTANQEETATITLTTSNGATTTFNVTGRCLPETFAIVAKVGNVWYALPSQGLNSETTPVGYPIEVDNNDSPKAVTSLPTKAEWELRNVYKVNGLNDRFAANGENLVFVNAENKTLYANNGNANIQTYAEYTNYAENNPERYEWVPTTTDLTNYTLKNVGRDKDLSINVNATFGTHASNIASNNLRFLPINATYNPFDMQVVEWYPTKVLVQTEATLASVSATVGGVAVENPVVTKMGGKLYEISGLPLESNPTKILTISYDSYSCSKVIPIIISQDTKTVSDAPFSTLTKAIYNYSDLVVRDGAVLNITGAKNTPDKFVNVTIYPTAKIVVPENNQLSVYSLTFFGGIDDIYDGEKYTTNKYGVPQLSLKGTLGKTVPTMDYIMRVNLDQMYQVGVPYDVNLGEITYWDGSAIKLGDELYVSAYDGQARANLDMNNTWRWEVNFDEKVLKAGVGYTISAEPQVENDDYSILRMPMKSNISSGDTEGEKKVNVVAYDNEKGVTITANHKGWNYLSNPYMTTISGGEADTKLVLGYLKETGTGPWEWVNDEIRYVTIPHDNGQDYYQMQFSNAVLKPFKSFFLQIAENGDLSFALASRQNAPARLLQQQTTSSEVEFELLLSNGKQSDNTGLLISEEYTPAYEINADLEKMTGAMSVYTIYNGYNLAYNALSPLNAEEQIPVGYIVPAKGEYTFALDPNSDLDAFKHIYLMDYEMGVTTDLIYDAYTFYTADTKSDKRFAIHIELFSDSENKPTGFENVGLDSEQPYKFMYRGILYIMHNGVIYTTTGQQLNTMDK